ncbi:MAG: ABC transporter permease [Oscillospiraceae bacterium]|nr:ABC transporter permease [Oscillospiraceae bacterium]
MQRLLRRKIWRELGRHWLRYLALALMIGLSMYLVVSLIGAADTVIIGTARHAEQNRVEDGQFTTFIPLEPKQLDELEGHGVTLEPMFYLDMTLPDGSLLRVFKLREHIDLAELESGSLPTAADEILLEKRYCEVKGLTPGDTVRVAGMKLKVSGVATTPDYDAPLRTMGDSTVDSANFGTAFVTEALYDRLAATGKSLQSEEYLYAYRLNGRLTDDELREILKSWKLEASSVADPYFREYWDENFGKRDDLIQGAKDLAEGNNKLSAVLDELEEGLTGDDYPLLSSYLPRETREDLKDLSEAGRKLSDGSKELRDVIEEISEKYLDPDLNNMRSFVPAGDNPRIGAATDDVIITRDASLAAGVIIMALLTYVISVFVIHGIETEQSVIGTLYALGVRRGELLRHYLVLPVFISLLAGAVGTALGYSRFGVPLQTADTYAYYSVPSLQTVVELYVIFYGVVMPPLTAALVNLVVIRRKLSVPALQMIRREEKRRDVSQLDLHDMGYIRRFQLRQLLREGRSALGVVLGIFVCLLLMMIGINAYTLCLHVGQDNVADTRYEYMYLYKYPEEQVPAGGSPAYAETLKKEVLGYNLDVTVLGLEPGNPYFAAAPVKSQNRVQISSAMAQKYGLKAGDQLILNDENNDRAYAFTVDGVVTYAPAFFVFMDLDSMRELFGASDDYYNTVFSDRDLHIDPGRLYSVSTRADVVKAADVFVNLMYSMVYTMIIASAAIMAIVMYLMMKVMIDRSAGSIALFKIFGYRRRELGRLFLSGNTLLITLGALLSIPLCKVIMDAMYPYLVSNVACAINLYFEPWIYGALFAGVMAVYFLIRVLLVRRIGKISPNEILKNRE